MLTLAQLSDANVEAICWTIFGCVLCVAVAAVFIGLAWASRTTVEYRDGPRTSGSDHDEAE